MVYTRVGARNSRFQTRTAYMLVLDIDYRPQCVAHAHQVRDLHSMVGRGARTRTFRVRVRVRVRVRYQVLGLGLGFRGAGGRPARQYFGWHGICVRIGYRLSSLDMGPCAWRRRLGAILGRGARTSTIRVLGLGLVRVSRVRHTQLTQ